MVSAFSLFAKTAGLRGHGAAGESAGQGGEGGGEHLDEDVPHATAAGGGQFGHDSGVLGIDFHGYDSFLRVNTSSGRNGPRPSASALMVQRYGAAEGVLLSLSVNSPAKVNIFNLQ